MIPYDSFESERLKKLIDNKKQFFNKQTNNAARQHLQNEILFLQNEILPIVLNNSTILYDVLIKYFILCYEKAVKYQSNALLLYIPITNEYTERPRVAIANGRERLPVGSPGAMLVACNQLQIENMDGCTIDIEPLQILIHDLL